MFPSYRNQSVDLLCKSIEKKDEIISHDLNSIKNLALLFQKVFILHLNIVMSEEFKIRIKKGIKIRNFERLWFWNNLSTNKRVSPMTTPMALAYLNKELHHCEARQNVLGRLQSAGLNLTKILRINGLIKFVPRLS